MTEPVAALELSLALVILVLSVPGMLWTVKNAERWWMVGPSVIAAILVNAVAFLCIIRAFQLIGD